MEFRALASSSSGNCYLFTSGGESVLIEAGIPWKKVQQAMDFDTRGIRFCLCSHSHGDHARHVKDVLKAGINVYGPEDVGVTWGCSCHYRFYGVLKNEGLGFLFPTVDWRVRVFPCVHDVPCYGYLIAYGTSKAVYIPDTSYSPVKFGPGVTHFLLSVNWSKETLSKDLNQEYRRHVVTSHMSLDTAKKLLAANDLSSVREIHLLHLSSENSDAEYFKREIAKQTGKPVYIANA